MKKNLMMLTAAAFLFLVTGCAGNNNDDDRGAGRNRTLTVRNNNLTGDVNNLNDNDNRRLEVADKAADKVVQLNEVDQATVIITGNDAYVAVKLDNNLSNNDDGRDTDNFADGNAGTMNGTGNVTGTGPGVLNRTDNNGNNDNNGISSELEQKIINQVRAADQRIDDVYVSVNADFYDRMTNYSRDIRAGRTDNGFFDDFNDFVRDIFPNLRNR